MTDSPMQSGNPWARFRKRLDDLEAVVKRNNAAPIRNASIDGPVTISHRGGVTATSPKGGTVSVSPEGAVSTAEDGSAVRLADGVAEVQAAPDAPWVPLEQVILDQVPAASDGIPPSLSPVPSLVGGDGVLYVRVPSITNADPVTVRVYASDVSPVAMTADNLVGIVGNGGTLAFRDIDGVLLVTGVDYFVVTIAEDVDGDAPTSTEVSGRVEPGFDPGDIFPITETDIADGAISTPKLQTNSVTAAKVAADVMVVNDLFARDGIHIADGSGAQIDITTADGIQQTYPDGSSRVSFPADPAQPNVIDADLYTRGLTVEGKMSVRGVDNEVSRASSVTLATGTTPPTTSIAVQNEWPVVAGMPAVPPNARGMFREGSTWRMLQFVDFGVPRMAIVPDSGAVTYQSLPFPAGSYYGATGIVKVGTSWYALAMDATFIARVYVFSASFALTGSWVTGGTALDPIATDGTDVFVAAYDGATIKRFNTSGTLLSTITTNAPTSTTYDSLLVGSFDFGATRFILVDGNSAKVLNSSGATQAAFETPYVFGGLGWNGAQFVAASSGGFRQSSTLTADRTLTAAYEWYDSDPVGGNFASGIGQTVTFTQKARSGLRFTTPPPSDDGSPNAPDSARLYIGSTTPNHLKGSPFVQSTSLLDFDLVSGVAPGANTFPAGTAARIESANGSAFFAGDGAAEFPQLEARVRQRSTHTGTQAASTISDFNTAAVSANAATSIADRNRANHTGSPTTAWSNGSQKITSLADGIAATDAVNKGQLDAVKPRAGRVTGSPPAGGAADINVTFSPAFPSGVTPYVTLGIEHAFVDTLAATFRNLTNTGMQIRIYTRSTSAPGVVPVHYAAFAP